MSAPPDGRNGKRDGGHMGVRRFSLPEKAQFLRAGKEDSYERNPGGVSFVSNHKFFESFERIKKLAQSGEKFFDTLRRRTPMCPPSFFAALMSVTGRRRGPAPQCRPRRSKRRWAGRRRFSGCLWWIRRRAPKRWTCRSPARRSRPCPSGRPP